MAELGRGVKAGLISSPIYGVISSVATLSVFAFSAPEIAAAMGDELFLMPFAVVIQSIISGIFLGLIYAAVYTHLPSKKSIIKAIVLLLIFWPISLLIGYNLIMVAPLLIGVSLGAILIWGTLLGWIWDGLGVPHLENVKKRLAIHKKGTITSAILFVVDIILIYYLPKPSPTPVFPTPVGILIIGLLFLLPVLTAFFFFSFLADLGWIREQTQKLEDVKKRLAFNRKATIISAILLGINFVAFYYYGFIFFYSYWIRIVTFALLFILGAVTAFFFFSYLGDLGWIEEHEKKAP